jgi:hypothetical protein
MLQPFTLPRTTPKQPCSLNKTGTFCMERGGGFDGGHQSGSSSSNSLTNGCEGSENKKMMMMRMMMLIWIMAVTKITMMQKIATKNAPQTASHFQHHQN